MTINSPFKVDWNNREDVIAYAKSLRHNQVVFKHPERTNYNITHADRFFTPNSKYSISWLVFRTE